MSVGNVSQMDNLEGYSLVIKYTFAEESPVVAQWIPLQILNDGSIVL